MARQRVDDEKRRKTYMSCVLTKEEKAAFAAHCRKHGFTNSTGLRRLVLTELGRVEAPCPTSPLSTFGKGGGQ